MIKKSAIAILIASTLTIVSACGVGEAKVTEVAEQSESVPLPVETTLAARADIFAKYATTGTLQSDSDAPVLARVAGEVTEILVEEGDFVEAGQILAKLDGDLLRLEMLEARANLDKVKGEYARLMDLQERGLVSKAMYEGLKFDIDALEAGYALKKLNYNYTVIRAPIGGVVSVREIKIGQQVYANDSTFRVTDTTKLVAYLKIPQTELVKFSAGHSVKLSVDSMPQAMFAANIDRISPTIDVRNGTFKATAYIDNNSAELAPGMFARFEIAYEKHEGVLVVPKSALIVEDNIAVVYVVSDGAATRRVVKTGIESDGLVEIIDGLNQSETVIVTGQTSLRDGSKVMASTTLANNITG